jgi:hypothetical protein
MTAHPKIWKNTWQESLGPDLTARLTAESQRSGKPDFNEAIEKLQTLIHILAAATESVNSTGGTVGNDGQQREVPHVLFEAQVQFGRNGPDSRGEDCFSARCNATNVPMPSLLGLPYHQTGGERRDSDSQKRGTTSSGSLR